MPLPVGFKVNGLKVTQTSRVPAPPRVQKIIDILTEIPDTELLTSGELSERLGALLAGGGSGQHPALQDYREKVDGKLFWGSRTSIAQLRKQLAENEIQYQTSEESHDED